MCRNVSEENPGTEKNKWNGHGNEEEQRAGGSVAKKGVEENKGFYLRVRQTRIAPFTGAATLSNMKTRGISHNSIFCARTPYVP